VQTEQCRVEITCGPAPAPLEHPRTAHPAVGAEAEGAVTWIGRCQVCGRRVASAAPGCPAHGPIEPSGDAQERSHVKVTRQVAVPGYEILAVIGRGGFGTVFAARAEPFDARVAIKVARRDRSEANAFLMGEIKALARIGAPHVPAVKSWGEIEGGSLYAVMELVEGAQLASRLAASAAPMTLEQIASIALAILSALEGVHAAGYLHGDLKPENILLDDRSSSTATLVDLGAAVPFSPSEGASRPSGMGEGLGTAEYMAPEQCDGQGGVDARADVYAMGVILYELLSGRPPFSGPRAAVLQSHRDRRPPVLHVGTAPALVAVVMRCLAKDRSERFPTVAALRVALQRALIETEPGSVERLSSVPISAPTSVPMSVLPRSSPPRSSPLSSPPLSSPPLSYAGAEAPSSSRPHERRKVGLVFFEGTGDAVAIHQQILSLGGQLASATGNRFVALYGHDIGDNPARRALRAGRELVKRGVCKRALVDFASVLVQVRADGARRFLSPLFTREDRFPLLTDAPGLFLMPAASEVMPEVIAAPVSDARGFLLLGSGAAAVEGQAAASLRAPAIIGREALIEGLLEGARRAARGGAPTLVGVVAEAGHGKSHLCREVVRRLRALDPCAEVIELRGHEPASGGADTTMRDLLQQVLDLPMSPPPDGGREMLALRLGASRAAADGPIIALALGWISPDAPALAARKAAPSALRSALTVAVGEALRKRAARGPLFIVLDDVHHADDAALGALEYAAVAEAGAPIWACALGRPAFRAALRSWGERASHREVHTVGALAPEHAAALCRELLLPAEDVPEPAVRRLVERTQAVPLLLVELVRGLKREGLVRRQPKGDGYSLATDEIERLPELPILDWIADSEIDALAPSLRAHARLVALLGADISIPEIEGVLRRLDREGHAGEFPLDARVGVARLLAAGVLIPHQHGRVGFRHALGREAIARKVPPDLRRRIHHAAYEYYRDAPAIAEERRLLQAAHHAEQAGLVAIAESAHLALAERARARHAYLEAERLYSRAIEPPSAPPVTAYRGRGLMRYRLGRSHDALVDLARAREMAETSGDAATLVDILLDEATVLDWTDEYKSAEERVERAAALAPAVVSPALEARLLLGLGRTLHRGSREDAAAAMLERAAALAESLGDECYETLGVSLLLLGFILQGLGRLDDARAALDRAISLCESHGDVIHLVTAINNRGLLWACLGDKERMAADLARVVVLARDLGQPSLELFGEYNLGEYLHLMDDGDAAAPHIRRAAAIEARRDGDAGRPVVALLEARFQLYRGAYDEARAIVERIRERQARARAGGHTDQLFMPSEEVLCSMIELATRDATPREWDTLEARSAHSSVGQERVEVLESRAITAARRGRNAEARGALDKALAAAARIPNVMGARLRRRAAEIGGLTGDT
jgi:eukaryotic-like serine/threonine-protein kinase